MKLIRYRILNGDSEMDKSIRCSEALLSVNLAVAKREAVDGEVVVDEYETTVAESTTEDIILDMLAEQEYRLCILELGGESV